MNANVLLGNEVMRKYELGKNVKYSRLKSNKRILGECAIATRHQKFDFGIENRLYFWFEFGRNGLDSQS